MNTADHNQYQEMAIDSLPGLAVVATNVEAQYKIGLKKEVAQIAVGDYGYGKALHESVQMVRDAIERLKEKVVSAESVSSNEATQLQHHYDRLVRLVQQPITALSTQNVASETGQVAPATSVQPQSKKLPPRPAPRNDFSDHRRHGGDFSITNQTHHAPVVPETQPHTGRLLIHSDETTNSQATTAEAKPIDVPIKISLSSQYDPQRSGLATADQIAKVHHLATTLRQQLSVTSKQKPALTDARSVVYEEAKDGIEQLEALAKKNDLTQHQFSRVTDIAKHVRQTLSVLRELSDTVPVVTKGTMTEGSPGISFVPRSITNQKKRVARRTIPPPLQSLPKPDPAYQTDSLTERYLLSSTRYQQWLRNHYSSPKAFEQILDATITKIEASTIDPIEKWLGELPASAFSFIADMPVHDVIAFARRPYEHVLADLQKQNVKYETFVAWRDKIDEMLSVVPDGTSLRFGQLFAIFMIESDMLAGE
jgi:hypothetical protein